MKPGNGPASGMTISRMPAFAGLIEKECKDPEAAAPNVDKFTAE
ncbi:MAG: hypothetical protein PHU23_05790 [Dehalococcoidales bacterium]|nr:hypothetical protein [Dehalococcoidales bacterium]